MLISPFLTSGQWVGDEFKTCLLTQYQSANNGTEKENDRATFLFVCKEQHGLLLEEFLKMPVPLVHFFRILSLSVTLRAWCFLVAQSCCRLGQVTLLKLELSPELSPSWCHVYPIFPVTPHVPVLGGGGSLPRKRSSYSPGESSVLVTRMPGTHSLLCLQLERESVLPC